jgi:hypothetical protein
MVVVIRLRQTEQCLEQPMDLGRGQQILPARHQRHALPGVVDRDCQVVAGWRVLAREHDVSVECGIDCYATMCAVSESERTRPTRRLSRIESQRVGTPAIDAFLPLATG